MKLLHVIQRYPPALGGSEVWAEQVARRQAERGHQVRVATLDIVAEEEFWQEAGSESEHFRLGRLDWRHGVSIRRFRRSLPIWTVHHLLLRGILDRMLGIHLLGPHSREMMVHLRAEVEWCDVVHLHTLPYPHNALGLRVARRIGRPVILTPHFHPGHPVYERQHQYRWMRRADRVVVVSTLEKEELQRRGVPAEKIIVTGCGCDEPQASAAHRQQAARDLRHRLHLDADTALVCCLARKTREKGIGALAQAVVQLRRQGRKVALVLAGPGLPWFANWWSQQTDEVRAAVHDLGQVSAADKRLLLAGSDVFAMPSRFEAFGIVYLEAWAAGLPVVGGEDGAQRAVIGEGGLTVPFDDAAATARALSRFLDDPMRAAAAVKAGREALASRFHWSHIGDRVVEAARELRPGSGRLVAVSSFYPPHIIGGAELACAGQVDGLAERGWETHVLAGRFNESSPRHSLVDEPGRTPVRRMTLHQADLSADKAAHDNPAAATAFGRLLHEVGPDVVHLHNLAGLGIDLVHQAADRKIPVVMTLHDFWGLCHRNTLTRPDGQECPGPGVACSDCLPLMGEDHPQPTLQRNADLVAALQRVSRFIAPSHYLADVFVRAGIPRERLQVLPNGMDPGRFAGSGPVPKDGPLLFMGYLGDHKGLHVLLQALALASGADDTLLLVAGEGDGRRMLEKRATDLGLRQRVDFLGQVARDRIPSLLSRSRALVVPSLWPENAPLTISEAMAAGRPVIASRMGGLPELVEHGRTGWLVPAGDPRALAEALSHLEREPGTALAYGQAARERARHFDRTAVLDALEELYCRLQEDPPGAWAWPAGVVGLAQPPCDPSAWQEVLRVAEGSAGPFQVVPWVRDVDGGADPRRRLQPQVLLLHAGSPLEAAAEAVALGIPFVAVCAASHPLADLAGDSGLGWCHPDPQRVGAELGRWLADVPATQRRMQMRAGFLGGLLESSLPLGGGVDQEA